MSLELSMWLKDAPLSSAPSGWQDVASENRLQKYVTLPWVSFTGGGSHSPLGYPLWGKPLHSHWEATGVSLGTHPSATLQHFPFSPDQIATLSQRQPGDPTCIPDSQKLWTNECLWFQDVKFLSNLLHGRGWLIPCQSWGCLGAALQAWRALLGDSW